MSAFLFVETIVIFLAILTGSESQEPVVSVPYAWQNINFRYPSTSDRKNDIRNGNFIPGNVVLNDVDVWPDKVKGRDTGNFRIFVSTPRFAPGIPATLSVVSSIKASGSFLLSPFPDWRWQKYEKDCAGFVSIDKFHIDECGLLWAVDTGRINEFSNPQRVCKPKIFIFSLNDNDKLILKYKIPDNVLKQSSSLTTIVTDSKDYNCLNSTAYIADTSGHGLVVFDLPQQTSWRIEHNFFYPYPLQGTFTIAGIHFDLMDGIFGMSLGTGEDRNLYFHSLASYRESWVPTSVLMNRDLQAQPHELRSKFHVTNEFRTGQCSLEVMTKDGIMIYNDLTTNAIMCWNTNTEAKANNTELIYQDNDNLQFISGLKLKGDHLWIASNRAQNILANVTDTDYRFRIIHIKSIPDLLKTRGRKCLPQF